MTFCVICSAPANFVYVGNSYCRPHFFDIRNNENESTEDHIDVTGKES